MAARRIAFVSFFGSDGGDFFSDALLGLLCGDARANGHEARMLRVVWSGRDARRDEALDDEFLAWLETRAIDVLVTDRLVRREPLARWRTGTRRVVLVPTGEGVSPSEPVDVAIFASPYSSRSSPRTEFEVDRRHAFASWLAAIDDPSSWRRIPGAHTFERGGVVPPERPLAAARAGGPLPYRPELRVETLSATGVAPRVIRTVYGNHGCPFAEDAAKNPVYAGLRLADTPSVLRLGCAFCHMGGDYEKRADAEVVRSVLNQVRHLAAAADEPLEAVLLSDQAPLRYLPALLRSAVAEGVPRLRWLLQTRADWLVRDEVRLREAIAVAREGGHRLSLYLVGFESFSDEELARYNKGTTSAKLVEAFERMHVIARESDGVFTYDATLGHSLVLFNPWTEPRHLEESARKLREHGMGALFSDLALNRLRLYPSLPLTMLAERDGRITDGWSGEHLAASSREKGYTVDIPWQFADLRTGAAYELSRLIREVVGREARVSHLVAVARWAGDLPRAGLDVAATVAAAGADLRRFVARFRDLQARAGSCRVRATTIRFGGACNNGCVACPNRDERLDDDLPSVLARVDEARTAHAGPLLLAGREPTVHPAFLEIVRRAAGSGQRAVGVVTNGRRFAYAEFTRASVNAGLRAASVKLFGATAAVADAIARDPGAHRQAIAGLARLRGAGLAVEIRVSLHASNLADVVSLPAVARSLGVRAVRVEAGLDAVGIANLGRAVEAIDALVQSALANGVSVYGTSPSRGARDWEAFPSD